MNKKEQRIEAIYKEIEKLYGSMFVSADTYNHNWSSSISQGKFFKSLMEETDCKIESHFLKMVRGGANTNSAYSFFEKVSETMEKFDLSEEQMSKVFNCYPEIKKMTEQEKEDLDASQKFNNKFGGGNYFRQVCLEFRQQVIKHAYKSGGLDEKKVKKEIKTLFKKIKDQKKIINEKANAIVSY